VRGVFSIFPSSFVTKFMQEWETFPNLMSLLCAYPTSSLNNYDVYFVRFVNQLI